MVSTLATSIEDDISSNQIASSEAIIEVDRGSWEVEHDVIGDCVQACFVLTESRALLLV